MFLGGIWDGLTDFASDIAGLAESTVKSVVSSALDALPSGEDIVVNSGSIVCGSLAAIDELTKEALKEVDDAGEKAIGRMISLTHASFFVTSAAIIDSSVFENAADGNNRCAACVAIVNLIVELFCMGIGKIAGCAAIGFASLGLGTVACGVFVEAVCGLVVEGTLVYTDAKRKACNGVGQEFDLYECS